MVTVTILQICSFRTVWLWCAALPRSDTLQDGQLTSLRCLGHNHTSPLVVADQARAHAQLPVLVRATQPFTWLLPCAGLMPRCHPSQIRRQAGGIQAWLECYPATHSLLRLSLQQHGWWFQACKTLQHHAGLASLPPSPSVQVVFGWWQYKGPRGKRWSDSLHLLLATMPIIKRKPNVNLSTRG